MPPFTFFFSMVNDYVALILSKSLRKWAGLGPLLLLPLAGSQAQAPVLTTLSPARNAVAAPVADPITLTFSQSLAPSSTAAVRVWGSQRQGLRASSRSGSNPLVITPAQRFAPGESVSVSVPATVQSASGVAAVPAVYQFTAAAGAGPAVFVGGPDVPAGYRPQWLTVGDFNDDGNLDTLVPNSTGDPSANYLTLSFGDGRGSFSPGGTIPVAAEVLRTATLDVDNDGDLDLLACCYQIKAVNIYLNNGSGSFTPAGAVAVGEIPASLSTGDIDADGDLDVLVGCANGLNVCRNDGTGTFAVSALLPLTSNQVTPLLVDLDGDGDLDLLQAGYSTASANWRRNDGTGTFGSPSGVQLGLALAPSTLLAADLDGDGDLDLAATDASGGQFSVRRNNGAGSFSGTGVLSVPTSQPVDIAAGDLDGDGDLDVVIANSGDANLIVLRNGGRGTFTNDSAVGAGLELKALAVADVDGDSDLDLLATSASGDAICVRLNALRPIITSFSPANGGVGATVTVTGTGLAGATGVSFGGVPATSYAVNAAGTSLTVTVPVGAVTSPLTVTTPVGTAVSTTVFHVDVPLEVTAVSPARFTTSASPASSVALTFSQPVSAASASQLRVFGSQGSGRRAGSGSGGGSSTLTFDPAQDFKAGEEVSVSVPATITTPGGVPTVPHVYQFRTGVSAVGPGTFGVLPDVDATPRSAPTDVATADLDGDGDLDVLASLYGIAPAVGSTVGVFLNDGAGHLALGSLVPVGPHPGRLAAADVDGDGDFDLLVANNDASTVSVRLNNGAASFAGGADVPVGLHPAAVTTGDVDGDGDLDLLAANYDANSVSVCLNAGAGSFGPGSVVPVGIHPTDVALGDVDNDGDLDLLTANQAGNTLSVRLNAGNGTFTGNQELGTDQAPTSLAVGDVDGDGDLDLLVANVIGPFAVNLARNDGLGRFTMSGIRTSSDVYDLALADVDADHDLDLLCTSHTGNWVTVSLNDGAGAFVETSQTFVDYYPQGVATADFDGDGDLDFVTANGGGTLSVRPNAPLPKLAGFTPTSGAAGSTVVLTGTQLQAVQAVQLNSLPVTGYTVNAAGTELTLTVPAGASTGAFSVSAAYNKATTLALTPATFTVVGPAPLTVTAGTPANNQRAAPRAANVTLTFSQPVSAASAAGIRVFGTQRGGRRSGTLSGAGTAILTFDPAQDLAPGETVAVVIPPSVQTTGGTGATQHVRQFTAAAGAGPAQFAAYPDVPLLPNATISNNAVLYAIATGDLNNDGNADLVMSTHYSGVELVRLGDGRGGFTAAPDVQSVQAPYGLDLADLNNDGNLDLIVANSPGNSVSVRLGTGTGTFTGVTNVPVISDPLTDSGNGAVTAADVNGDGFLDLLVGAYGRIAVRLNAGTGTEFREAPNVSIDGFAEKLFTADVNGDGNLDLILRGAGTSIASNSRVNVLLGNGQGRFTSLPVVLTGAASDHGVNSFGSNSSALGDVNGDGYPDMVLTDAASANVKLLLGSSTGVFAAPTNVAVGGIVRGLGLADIDGDGDLDLLAADYAAAVVYLRLNTGTGTFTGTGRVAVGAGPFTLLTPDLDNDGDLDLLVGNFGANCVTNVRLNQAPPTIVSFTPPSGPSGTVVTLTGTEFLNATTVSFNGVPATSFVVHDATHVMVTVPAGATTGLIAITTPAGTGTSLTPFTVALPDLFVTTPQNVTGDYRNVTITSTGVATLTGPLSATGTVLVQAGGVLQTACQPLTGPGSFTLEAGATLGICAPEGISASGATGAIQVAGLRTFSTDASYLYNGTVAQVTGLGLPAQVRNLTVDNAGAGLTLSQDAAVAQVLSLANGDLITSGHVFTLRSTPATTALVVNGNGVVVGDATVQRAIDSSLNPATGTGSNPLGLGYRHYSSPVHNSTVSDLATTGFTPEVSQASVYNSSATPGATTPFPTVYGYEQGRLATATNNYAAFDKGFVVPASLGAPLAPGQGYAVNIGAAEVVDFVGTLNNGTIPLSLTRAAPGTTNAAEAGWQLLGNPYPAPLDYSRVAAADRDGLEGAIYVYSSTARYLGQYRSYANGFSTGSATNPVIPVGQAFFARVADTRTSATLTFRNSQRLTTNDATAFQRSTADLRPQVRLTLQGSTGNLDVAILYFERGATATFDAAYDARKLPNPTGLNLSTDAAGQALAIDGRPLLSANASLTVPLHVYVPTTGSYSLRAAELLNLGGLRPYLRDLQLGTLTDLTQQASYAFTQSDTFLGPRFELVFSPQPALAVAPATLTQQVILYPNPAKASAYLELPASLGSQVIAATLLDAVGRRVSTLSLPAQGTAAHQLDLRQLPSGIYALQLQTSAGLLVKRLVVE